MKQAQLARRAVAFLRSEPIAAIFLALFVGCCFAFPSFFTAESVANLFRSTSTTGIVAIGMTLVILCGDIDLSVGAVLALGGVVFATAGRVSVALGAVLCVLTGLACGLCTGLLTVKARLPAFIASLSTQYAVRGIVYIVTDQKAIHIKEPSAAFSWFGNGSIGVVPVPALVFLVLAVAAAWVLRYTGFGRNIYAAGGNTEAALMMGVKTDVTRIAAFVICGGLSAVAGIITTSRLGAAQAVAGADMEMTVIAAIVLGGTLLRGGVGKIAGTVFGALFIKLLITAFNNIPSISTYWQNVITGIFLLAVVFGQNYVAAGRRRPARLPAKRA